MDLDSIQTFVTVADHGSIQGAAAQLGLARSTVRARLRKLDHVVGKRLLESRSDGVRLTSSGEVFLEHARTLLGTAEAMLVRSRRAATEARGVARVALPVGMRRDIRIAFVQQLRREHPGLVLEVLEDEDPLRLMRERLDLILHFGPPPERAEGWFSRVIARVPVVAAATPQWLERGPRLESIQDLSAHPLWHWAPVGAPWTTGWPRPEGPDHPITPSLVSRNPNVIREFGMHEGICLTPSVAGDLKADGLVRVLPDEIEGCVEVRCLSHTPSRSDPRIRALEDAQRKIAADLGVG